MSVATKDGTWMHAQIMTEIHCDRCGLVARIHGFADRNIDDALKKHAWDKHGGIRRGGGV